MDVLTRERILQSYRYRIETEISVRNPLIYLKEVEIEDHLDTIIGIVYLYTRPKKKHYNTAIFLTEVISALGHSLRSKLKLPKNSSLAAKTGAFLLYTFEKEGVIQTVLGQGLKGHHTYIVQVLKDEILCNLWNTVPSGIEKLPSEVPYADWTSVRHESGMTMVKTGSKEVLNELTPETHPIVFECLNRAQRIGWTVNKDVFSVYHWALANRTEAFAEIWELASQEAKLTKLREARSIGDIAKRFIDKKFYHLYYYDFRGRKYPTTAYLHEQGSDLARGLLLRADKKALGKEGFFWLMVCLASNWGNDAGREDGLKTDKIPLKERYLWAITNEEVFLSYAEAPKENQGWMKADKPWQFLAGCVELKKLRQWQWSTHGNFDSYEYECHLEGFIDGSTNGSQHLAALTRDEVTAVHVNLVRTQYPGDLYAYVAKHVWERLERIVAKYSEEELEVCEDVINKLIEIKKEIAAVDYKSELRKNLVNRIKEFKQKNDALITLASPVFWLRIRDTKHRRKIVKRNTMTLPYGGTPYGLGEQQIADAKKHGIELLYQMEHRWGAYLGREIYEDCRKSLERPMQLLKVFEEVGSKAEKEGKFLSWHTPLTNFPVVQNYTEGITKKIYVQYGPPTGPKLSTGYYENTLQLSICFVEDHVPSKGKQSQSASPNIIHSLDAAHLAYTVHKCNFPITTIHDSYGCLFADMPDLFRFVRETFVELYSVNPIYKLMNEMNGDLKGVKFGSLDITSILESEYAFS
jgi:DNA-directed RNA polymerase